MSRPPVAVAPPRRVLCPQRRLSADVSPSLVSWLTAVVGMRLQAVLEQMPVTPEQVLPYVRRLGEPASRQVTPPPTQKPRLLPDNPAPRNPASRPVTPPPATTPQLLMTSPALPVETPPPHSSAPSPR